jgi:fatty acid desaturase
MTAAHHFGSPWVLLLAGIFIGAFQHHLSILNHEANHFLLFRWRTLNEGVRALTAWSTGFRLDYRAQHAAHHRSLGAADDPDLPNYLHYPLSPRDFAVDVCFHLSGLAALTQFVRQSQPAPQPAAGAELVPVGDAGSESAGSAFDLELLGIAALQAVLAGAIYATTGSPWLYVLLWGLPLATVAKSLTHFRNVVEHTRTQDVGDAAMSRHRTILSGPVESFFFAPLHFNYHAEHHLYPGIPFHGLPEAHRLLAAQPGYRDAVDVERGYLHFLWRRAIRRSPALHPGPVASQ